MKSIFLLLVVLSFTLLCGCILDDWLGNKDEILTPPSEIFTTINGTVNVPDAGAGKVSLKIQYKAAPSTTKVYLLLSSRTWAEKLDFVNNYEYVTTVDVHGNYQFDYAAMGTSYCIVIDVNSDGKCDELVAEIIGGDKISAAVTSFIREVNTDAKLMLSIHLDKDQYAQGESIKFTVTGYIDSSANIHVEVWNENGSGKYIWTSIPVAVNAGEVKKEFTHTIPVDGWPSTSTGADYKAFAAIDAKLLASDEFEVTGTNAGDSIAPEKGVLAINDGAEKAGYLEVTLNITVPDATATQMIISNASGDYEKSMWEVSKVSRPWTLTSGIGNKNVFIKFADSSGNESGEFTDNIEYTEDILVTNVTSDKADGTYNSGEIIDLQVEFLRDVNVTGIPQLTLADGIGPINYYSGSGSKNLVFRYNVQNIHDSSPLKYVAINSLNLNGGTIKNASTAAILTLPVPGTTGSLDSNKTIVVTTDTDGDGLSDANEIAVGTNLNNTDSEGDGMPDGWEVTYNLNPLVDDTAGNPDADGLVNLSEYTNGTKPDNPDTDGDGLTDGDEINIHNTNPLNINTDGDWFDDGIEVTMFSNPLVPDGEESFGPWTVSVPPANFTSFEDMIEFPTGPLSGTLWGSCSVKGLVTIEDVGASPAYGGQFILKLEGRNPESSFIGWLDCPSMQDYEANEEYKDHIWVSVTIKSPRAPLPTDINKAFNMGGLFFAIDENGYMNAYNAEIKQWLRDTKVVPDDWFCVTVHRNFPRKIANMWIETRQAFAEIPTAGPEPFMGSFRASYSSVGAQNVFLDLWSVLPFAPF